MVSDDHSTSPQLLLRDDDAWTQISGPSDEEMSVSDDASIYTTMQCQTPKAILDAERDDTYQPSDSHTFPGIHGRYTGFATLLCKETATEDADPHIQEGLPVAVDIARSIPLDEPSIHGDDHDIYAFALVIHVWQIVCFRMQHGTLPSADIDVSLCLNLSTYFLSAHTIVEHYCTVSSEELRCAVQYWEDRLKLMGQGNRWMEDPWTKTVQYSDQEKAVCRNEIVDRYLEALENDGKEGLTISIIEQETKGDWTQLHTMIQQQPDAKKELRRQIASMLYSMDSSLLTAMIQGQLPRLAKIRSRSVYRAVKELNEQDFIQPGTYMTCICDHVGLSPTPHQWQRVCEQMLKYVQTGGEHNDLAQQIDQRLHPKSSWPKELARKGLRRYTEWRSYMENVTHTPDSVHRHWVKFFVEQLQKRMEGQPIHAPLTVPVIEIGFSNNPRRRLRQHRHHETSNYLMNLAEAIFETEYPGAFQLQQMIVFACYRPIQPWLSMIVITQLAQGYVERGEAFSHEPLGQSNASLSSTVPAGIWAQFEDRVYEDGSFAREVEANTRRLQARELEAINAEFLRVQEEAHVENMSLQAALEMVIKRLHGLEAEYQLRARRSMTPDKGTLPLAGPSTTSVGLSIATTASRPLRVKNATITPSDSVAFTLSVRDAGLLNLSSDVLPIDVLRTLRNKLRIWKASSTISWATAQSSKKSRSCITTRLERKKSQWNDGYEYACAMCEQRMRLCVVVDSAERILLLPRKVAEDEGRGPTDTKYWTR